MTNLLADLDLSRLGEMSRAEKEELLELLEERVRRERRNKFHAMYPDLGPLSRVNYPKHLDFFAVGAQHKEVAFVAANRVGKSICVCYELTCHLTGLYKSWWPGRRFDRPVIAWIAGEDTKAVRESLQPLLFGPPGALGTGLIPGDMIADTTARSGVPEAIDTASINHLDGGMSRLVLKSYDQGRESFQASQVDVMVFDEEPPMDIFTEGLTRTMSTVPGELGGIVRCSFTPLRGGTDVVLRFLGDDLGQAA
ncbi:MAG: terminase large subunit domain-containing protein [Gammaproteobacteria bacterium]